MTIPLVAGLVGFFLAGRGATGVVVGLGTALVATALHGVKKPQ